MKKFFILTTMLGSMLTQAMAIDFNNQAPLKLSHDSLHTGLTAPNMLNPKVSADLLIPEEKDEEYAATSDMLAPEINANAIKTGNLRPYKFKDDMTYVGVPLFVAGIIAKSEKVSFRQNTEDQAHARTRLLTNFHSEIDNYTQFAPAILAAGLNFAGVQGRSDTWRFLTSSAMSYAIMAAIVNPIKYTAKEMRPDGSTRNSWPSGHTATAFVSATILHKEYGLTRSPWYSVAGYAVATATGVMRVLNNRHWVSDVLSGAGVGIFSTELAYGLSDIIFKGNHLKRNDLSSTESIIDNPSFFSISMGIGLGSKNLTFNGNEMQLDYDYENKSFRDINLKFAASTVVGAEGAYFFNKYIGVGGRLRVKSTPIKGWDIVATRQGEDLTNLVEIMNFADMGEWISSYNVSIESDHITEFAADLGVYFNLPLSHRWALGSKLLVGRSIIQDLDIDGHANGHVLENMKTTVDPITETVNITPVFGNPYDITWDYVTVSGNNTTKFGTGLSVTYAYKSNFSFKAFVDYDFTRKRYTMTANSGQIIKTAWPSEYDQTPEFYQPTSSSTKKNMHSFVLGGAFCISF